MTPNAYCPGCRHRDPRTGRCREVPPYDYASQAPIVCSEYDGPPLTDTEPDDEES